jgi:hypothetical protein
MTALWTEAKSAMTSRSHTLDSPHGRGIPSLAKEEFDEILRALEVPFDANLVQWRLTEWSEDGSRGLMMPYADPRAYTDRLNNLFTPAGWTRRYTVQASIPVQRSKRVPAAKILVTCEVTIDCIGTNSGTGEEWSDKENALTGAEAQAFKRALSCFGLGRYLYDMVGEWIELDQRRIPKKIPTLPRWATPRGWLAGLRPKPRRNRRVLVRANGHGGNCHFESHEVNGNSKSNIQSLVSKIDAMEKKIGYRLYRGLLKRVARVWSPQQIGDRAVLEQVLAQMQGAQRGVARLEAAQARLAPEVVQKIIVLLNAPPTKVEDLQTLHSLVVALEKEVEAVQTQA